MRMSHGTVLRNVHAYGIAEIPWKAPSAMIGRGIVSCNPDVPARLGYYQQCGSANAEVKDRSTNLILSQRFRAEHFDGC